MIGLISESERLELIRETFNESDIPMFWCDENRFLLCNNAFLRNSGYSSDELFELGFNDLSHSANSFQDLSEIHDENGARKVKVISWLLKKKTGEKELYELRLTRLPHEADAEKDKFYGVMQPLENIEVDNEMFTNTTLKLHDSLAASHQGIWQWLSTMNRATMIDQYIGITKNEMSEVAFDESSFLDRVYPRDRARVELTWKHFLAGHGDYYNDEYRICNKEDKFIWVCSRGKVMERKTDGSPLRVTGTISDISDDKEKQEIILRQTQKLVDYAFMNSHLLRGPASSIIGLVDLLKLENCPENLAHLKKATAQLDDAIHEINEMIEETGSHFKLPDAKVSKISLISNDSLKSLILMASLEHYRDNVELSVNDLQGDNLEILPGHESTDLVICDENCCDDIYDFLKKYESKYPTTPMYILAERLDVAMIDKLNHFSFVNGIILKYKDHRGILKFIENLSR